MAPHGRGERNIQRGHKDHIFDGRIKPPEHINRFWALQGDKRKRVIGDINRNPRRHVSRQMHKVIRLTACINDKV